MIAGVAPRVGRGRLQNLPVWSSTSQATSMPSETQLSIEHGCFREERGRTKTPKCGIKLERIDCGEQLRIFPDFGRMTGKAETEIGLSL